MKSTQTRKKQRQKAVLDPVVQRLVEMTFAPIDQVAEWLTKVIGAEIIQREPAADNLNTGVLIVRNPYLSITGAFSDSADPVTRAVSLGFITGGMFWTKLFPGLLEAVNAEWKIRQKAVLKKVETDPSGEPSKNGEGEANPASNGRCISVEPTFEAIFRRQPS